MIDVAIYNNTRPTFSNWGCNNVFHAFAQINMMQMLLNGFWGFRPQYPRYNCCYSRPMFNMFQPQNYANQFYPAQNYRQFYNPVNPFTFYPRQNFNQSDNSTNQSKNDGKGSVGEIDKKGEKLKGKGKGSAYGPEFLAKAKKIAQEIDCDYKDLIAVMNSESGLNTKAVNPSSKATGLIQFMPQYSKQVVGKTTQELYNMSPLEQLDYVEKYLKVCKKTYKVSGRLSAGQLYTLVFTPAYVKREVLATKGEEFYSSNKGLDVNKDGKITMTDLSNKVRESLVDDNSFLA